MLALNVSVKRGSFSGSQIISPRDRKMGSAVTIPMLSPAELLSVFSAKSFSMVLARSGFLPEIILSGMNPVS